MEKFKIKFKIQFKIQFKIKLKIKFKIQFKIQFKNTFKNKFKNKFITCVNSAAFTQKLRQVVFVCFKAKLQSKTSKQNTLSRMI